MKRFVFLFPVLLLFLGCTSQSPVQSDEPELIAKDTIHLVDQVKNNVSFKIRTSKSFYVLDIALVDQKNNPSKSENLSLSVTINDEEGLLYFEKRYLPEFDKNYSFIIPRENIKRSFYSWGEIKITLSGTENISVSSDFPLSKFSADEAYKEEDNRYKKNAQKFNTTKKSGCFEITPELYGYQDLHTPNQKSTYFRVDVTVKNTCDFNANLAPDSFWLQDSSKNYFPPTARGNLTTFFLNPGNSRSGYLLYNLYKRNPSNLYLYYNEDKLGELIIR